MKKQIACPECKGNGYITLSRKYDDYCGIGSVMCPGCGGTGLQEADMTIADKIRAMNDDDLRNFLCGLMKCEGCAFGSSSGCNLKDWLQMYAKEG